MSKNKTQWDDYIQTYSSELMLSCKCHFLTIIPIITPVNGKDIKPQIVLYIQKWHSVPWSRATEVGEFS